MKFFLADIQWGLFLFLEYLKKIFWLPFFNLPTQQPFRHDNVRILQDVPIPMRDGTRLMADIYTPAAEEPFPVVLIRMPYGKREAYCYMPAHGKYWAKHGYACVIQDVRGKWDSEGSWQPFINEANDGYDTLNWIADQSWCNGNIGMTGESYYGYTQWAVAPLNHPNLKCIVPGNTAADIYGSWMYNNHVFCSKTMGVWLIQMLSKQYNNPFRLNPYHLPLIEMAKQAGLPERDYRACLEHPERDSYWEQINVDRKFDQVRIPVLHWGGWYDVFLQGTLDAWQGMMEKSDPNKQWLIVSPTDHETTPMFTGRIGQMSVGSQAWTYDKVLEFFDHFLMGVENKYSGGPFVEIFTLGDNQWRVETNWPPARAEYTSYFFHSNGAANGLAGDGKLNVVAPQDEPSDHFEYDPARPVNFAEKIDLWHLAEAMKDRTSLEKRQDVLVYNSEPLSSALEVTGPILARIYASSSAKDTDFTATLVDVFPDGYAQLVQEGIVRARYRQKGNPPSLVEPGKIYPFEIDLWATSYVFQPGHRIRVEITSSNFDRYDRNLNTGGTFAQKAEYQAASQTIYHDRSHPSCIILPIIPGRA